MKVLRLSAVLILITGVCLTGRAVYLHAKAQLAGVLIRRAWEQSLQSGKVHAPWSWADTYPIARLRIPHLDYDEIVLEGAMPRTLAFGPARLFSGAHMGEAGNVVLAGHRTSWFQPLEAIKQGDAIDLEWFDQRSGRLHERAYAVAVIRVVEPHKPVLTVVVVTTTIVPSDETATQRPEQTTSAVSRRGSISRPAAHNGPAWAPRGYGSQAR